MDAEVPGVRPSRSDRPATASEARLPGAPGIAAAAVAIG
eukprot:CAMPEP_0175721002 /NCGR_PEP_ID=MMETSP0097-20121207/45485_1 /TAXON_ID=311494 /ORGANISM="Alexandrium monilatum, Strain CCMP3105" /LENGTH=38 /DNA_ID= /DNA_START= /DNA_END= /DNA_ORIENTATION=